MWKHELAPLSLQSQASPPASPPRGSLPPRTSSTLHCTELRCLYTRGSGHCLRLHMWPRTCGHVTHPRHRSELQVERSSDLVDYLEVRNHWSPGVVKLKMSPGSLKMSPHCSVHGDHAYASTLPPRYPNHTPSATKPTHPPDAPMPTPSITDPTPHTPHPMQTAVAGPPASSSKPETGGQPPATKHDQAENPPERPAKQDAPATEQAGGSSCGSAGS